MNEGAGTAVEVVEISKNYGPVTAVRSVSLSVPGGEYFVLLGPSAAARPPCSGSSAASCGRNPIISLN